MSAAPSIEAETGDTQLVLRGVGKAFGDVVALRDVDMTINQGDFLSLLGPSGCGKSTALRLIAGLSAPSAGRLEWFGPPMGKTDVGFVFQEPTLMPWATVYDNVWLPLRLQGVSRDAARDRVAAVLDQVNLTGFEEAVPRELSGGMKKRAGLARAIATQPRLLFLDELTTAPPAVQARSAAAIRTLAPLDPAELR